VGEGAPAASARQVTPTLEDAYIWLLNGHKCERRMDRLRILFQSSLADFRERTRRYSFLITMIGVMFFGYLVITGQYTIQFGEYRSLYNSAWAGSLMAVCSSIMMAIIGFYLIRGSIKRGPSDGCGSDYCGNSDE